ncbi:MAG: ABC transporter substrate-binding protein [Gammaproteobacteria bacterium]|nr:ABC transporter substrate-binding protein [Gammaproteobacteria bacterium]
MKDKELKATPDQIGFENLDRSDQAHVERAVRNRFDRRDALKLMMTTGITMSGAYNLLLAGKQAVASTPKSGGALRAAVAVHGPADTLDPNLFTSQIDYSRGRAHYNALCQLDESLAPQPELAESWGASADAKEWTFQIRKGVRFHDGTPLSADDVVWSMNRHLGDDSTSAIKDTLSFINEWRKVGPYEVKAELNTPNADLPILLGGLYALKVIKNGTNGDGIGTGPFVLQDFSPGIRSLSTRNENYWRSPAHLDAIEIFAITDPLVRVNAVVSGDIHLAAEIEPKSIAQIEDAPNVSIISIPTGAWNGICALKNTDPGSSDDFVKAMQHIQDRERIVNRILKGHGSAGNDHPISSAYGADHCHELPIREFDPDKAKFHLDKSGIDSATLHVAPVGAGIEEVCLLMQVNLAKIGFDLNIKRVPNDGYWSAVWRVEPMNVTSWSMRPTANAMLSQALAPGAPWNDSYWDNPRMGELLKLSLAELDPDKRHAMYCEMQTLVHNESGMIIPMHLNILDAKRDSVYGLPSNPLGNLGASEYPEFVWLDE